MSLQSWISDKTMKLLKMSEVSVVDYIISQASVAQSPEFLFIKLCDLGFPNNSEGRDFANELFIRVPKKSKIKTKNIISNKDKETDLCSLNKKNASFKLILEQDEESLPINISLKKEKVTNNMKKNITKKKKR